ncbi:MAG: EVE domain-containing protein [Nitrososphaera sp.]|nr:EVE domain-containing protein [Nitrososphaera sp.]
MAQSWKFHLFVTPKYFDQCLDYGLFGVSEPNLSQLANVRQGDLAFVYTARPRGSRTIGCIYGPFEVISDLFYNETLVWTPSANDSNKDKFPYRVKVRILPEHAATNPVPVQTLWDLRDQGKIKSIVDSSALIDKAVCTLLWDEGRMLLQALLQANPNPAHIDKTYRGHIFTEGKVNLLQFRGEGIREFRLEGLLEAFLLMNPHHLYQMSGIPEAVNETFRAQVFNQVSAYVAGGAIDIVCLYEKKVRGLWLTLLATVFELKKNTLSMDNLDQLIENVKWAARLLPGASDEMVRGVLVGRTFGGDSEKKLELQKALQSLEKNSWIKVFEYAVEDADSVSFKEIPAG